MSEPRELRAGVASARDELDRLRGEIAELRPTAGLLPTTRELDQKYAALLPKRRIAWLTAALVGLTIGGTYWALLEVVRRAQADPIVIHMGPTDPTELREQLARLRSALPRAREEIDEARFGALPSLPTPEPAAESYPGLRAFGIERTVASDDLLRWTNIGVAACTVHEPAIARWAIGVLRSTVPSSGAPIAPPLPKPLSTAIGTIHTHCMMEGHSLLRLPAPPPGADTDAGEGSPE